MQHRPWNRSETIGLAAIVVALIVASVTLFSAEVREWLGFRTATAVVAQGPVAPSEEVARNPVPLSEISRDAAKPSDQSPEKTKGKQELKTNAVTRDAPETVADGAVPPVEELKEEDAAPGSVRGTVTVCKFGPAPSRRNMVGGREMTADRSPICVKSDGRVFRLQLDKNIWNAPPVYYQGNQYGINELNVGDLIEARMVGAGSGQRGTGITIPAPIEFGAPRNAGIGAAVLQDIQLLKRAGQ